MIDCAGAAAPWRLVRKRRRGAATRRPRFRPGCLSLSHLQARLFQRHDVAIRLVLGLVHLAVRACVVRRGGRGKGDFGGRERGDERARRVFLFEPPAARRRAPPPTSRAPLGSFRGAHGTRGTRGCSRASSMARGLGASLACDTKVLRRATHTSGARNCMSL